MGKVRNSEWDIDTDLSYPDVEDEPISDEVDSGDVEPEPEPPKEMTDIDRIYKEIREEMSPYFEDGEIEYYLQKNNGDVNATIYEMLIIKSEDSTINVSGLNTNDTSGYFKRLASRYKPYNTGILR